MASLNIGKLVVGKELLDRRDKIVPDVPTPRASHKKRRTVKTGGTGIWIGEIGHGVERGAQHGNRNSEFQDLVVAADQVGQEELADGKGLDGHFHTRNLNRQDERTLSYSCRI